MCAASDSPPCSGMSGLQPTKSGPHNPIAVRVSLPVATCIKFMSLVLTSRVLAGSAPSYFNNLVQAHATARPLGLAWLLFGKVVSCGTWIQTIFTFFPKVGIMSWALYSRGYPLFVQEALENIALPRAPTVLTALIFELNWKLNPPLSPLLSRLYVSPFLPHSSALLVGSCACSW